MQCGLAARYSGVIDVLERVLDKGIVIDAWARVSFVGIDLLTVEGGVVIVSITTDLGADGSLVERAPAPGLAASTLRPSTDMS